MKNIIDFIALRCVSVSNCDEFHPVPDEELGVVAKHEHAKYDQHKDYPPQNLLTPAFNPDSSILPDY